MATPIDQATLFYASSNGPQYLVRNLVISDDGVGTVYSGWNGVFDLAIKAQISKAGARGVTTVKLQDSADGLTGWADVVTMAAMDSTSPTAIDFAGVAVRDFIRVSWTMTGVSKHASLSVSVVPVGLAIHS